LATHRRANEGTAPQLVLADPHRAVPAELTPIAR
jgi:hypothetical protein